MINLLIILSGISYSLSFLADFLSKIIINRNDVGRSQTIIKSSKIRSVRYISLGTCLLLVGSRLLFINHTLVIVFGGVAISLGILFIIDGVTCVNSVLLTDNSIITLNVWTQRKKSYFFRDIKRLHLESFFLVFELKDGSIIKNFKLKKIPVQKDGSIFTENSEEKWVDKVNVKISQYN